MREWAEATLLSHAKKSGLTLRAVGVTRYDLEQLKPSSARSN